MESVFQKKLFNLIIGVLLLFYNNYNSSAQTLIISGVDTSAHNPICKKVLEEAYTRIGVDVIFQNFPISRSLLEANSGRIDGETFRVGGLSKKFPNLLMIEVPIDYSEAVAFTKLKNINIEKWTDLKPYKIGIRKGILSFKQFLTDANISFEEIPTDDQLFKMLNLGRIDIVIHTKLAGIISIKENNISEINISDPPLDILPLYHYLHKKNSDLIPKITTVLKEMQDEGRIEEIKNDYINKTLLK